MFKDKLSFDPTDANTLAASDFVGAVVRTAAGASITSTSAGPKEALDVNITNAIMVDLNGFYDVSTNPTPDTVGNILNTRAAAPDQTGQIQRVTAAAASSDAVVAANVHGQDVNAFGMVYNGATWDRLTGTGGAVNVSDGGGSLTVDGTVAVTQSTNPWVVSDAAEANTALASSANPITDTVGDIKASAGLAARKYLWAQNLGPNNIYFGATGVTAATGLRMAQGAIIEMRLGAAVMPQAITAGAGQTGDLRLLEAS